MKKSVCTLLVAAVFVIGCNDDSGNGSNNTKPEEVAQPQACEIEGQVRCGDACIDPKTSQAYCGADEKCEHFTACGENQSCSEGKCTAVKPATGEDEQPVSCETGEHEYNKTCEPDSVDHCGTHDKSCLTVEGWADGKCESGQCVLEQCQSGMHLNGDVCELDTIEHCGSTENNCANAIEGWKEGACSEGACIVASCMDGYHITEAKTCEQDPQGCETDGQVRCEDVCIDPKTSQAYCGADEKCENYKKCEDNESCKDGVCERNVSADDPSFATDDGIPDGITFRLINKSGKDICFSGKFKVYIKKGGPQDGWAEGATTYELECHLSAPTSEAGGWAHWYENKLTLAPDAYRDYDFTEFTEYWGNGQNVTTKIVPLDEYVNGQWYFFSEDNPGFIASNGAGGVPAIKLGFAAMKDDGTRGDNPFLLHVRPVKASDGKLEKGKKYNLVIYEAVTDSKYWHCD
ncbi:MAG: hypothetical protein J6A01_12265 [Proteobacteria bacterium]|nr:hypothetical protein [Pseudomonadota bacterium]